MQEVVAVHDGDPLAGRLGKGPIARCGGPSLRLLWTSRIRESWAINPVMIVTLRSVEASSETMISSSRKLCLCTIGWHLPSMRRR